MTKQEEYNKFPKELKGELILLSGKKITPPLSLILRETGEEIERLKIKDINRYPETTQYMEEILPRRTRGTCTRKSPLTLRNFSNNLESTFYQPRKNSATFVTQLAIQMRLVKFMA